MLGIKEEVSIKKDYSEEDARHNKLIEMGADCKRCVLYRCGRGPVLGEVRPKSKLLIIGEGPGPNEVEEGAPFVGASGRFLEKSLFRQGLTRNDVSITNAFLCRPPGDGNYKTLLLKMAKAKKRVVTKVDKEIKIYKEELLNAGLDINIIESQCKAKKKELLVKYIAELPIAPHEACQNRLNNEMQQTNWKVVLGVGGESLRSIAKALGIPYGLGAKVEAGKPRLLRVSQQHGHPLQLEDGRIVCASVHPAAGFRSKPWLPIIDEDLQRAARLSQTGQLTWQWPKASILDTFENVIKILDRMIARPYLAVTVDIETNGIHREAHITCIGLGQRLAPDDLDIISVQVRKHDEKGSFWYSEEETKIIKDKIRTLLDNAPILNNHNIIKFDNPRLFKEGYLSSQDKDSFDTMVAHHNTDESEHAHGLGFVGGRCIEDVPMWKLDADTRSVSGVDERVEAEYNAKDIAVTAEIAPVLYERMASQGTLNTYNIDVELSKIARDMGNLGLTYDFKERIRIFIEESLAMNQARDEMQKIVGYSGFNPGSRAHIQEWMYNDKKIPVPFVSGADKEKFDSSTHDYTDGAVDETALQMIINAGAPKDVLTFIDHLFKYKASQKLKSTYVQLDTFKEERGIDFYADSKRQIWELDKGLIKDCLMAHTEEMKHNFYKNPKNKGLTFPADELKYTKDTDYDKIIHTVWGNTDRLLIAETATSKIDVEDPLGEKVYLDPIFNVKNFYANRFDLRLHPNFNIHVVPSGRFAASPNVLAIPKDMRAMIIAPEGYLWSGGDAEQIEARLFAINSNDQMLIDLILRKVDIHLYNWCSMCFTSEADIWKAFDAYMADGGKDNPKIDQLRGIAKVFMYALSYGAEIEALYTNIVTKRNDKGEVAFPGITLKDVKKWYKGWHKNHPATKRYFEGLKRFHEAYGYIASLDDSRKFFMKGGFDRNAAANFPQQCWPLVQRVLTNRGYISGERLLQEGTEDKLAWTGRVWSKFNIIPRGLAKLVDLKLTNGYKLRCSINHKVKVAREKGYEWEEVQNLKEDDIVAINLSREMEFGTPMNEEDAYWLGYYTGNGHFYRCLPEDVGKIDFYIGDRKHITMEDNVNKFLKYMLDRYLPHGEPSPHPKGSKMVTIGVGARRAVEHFERLGAKPNENAHTKRIPDTIWGADLKARKAYMRGMIDSDGFIQWHDDGKVEIHLCSEDLVRDFFLLGSTIGLDGTMVGPIKSGGKMGNFTSYSVFFYQALVKASLGYEVKDKMRANNLAPLFELEKFKNANTENDFKHLDRGERKSAIVLRSRARKGGSVGIHQLVKMGFGPDYNVSQVKSVTPVGDKEEPVFTLSMEHEDHSYVAEGVISKNSSAADKMNRALIQVAKDIPYRGWSHFSGLAIQIHDAIYVQVQEARAKEAAEIVKKAMESWTGIMEFPAKVKKPNKRLNKV